MQRLNNLSSGGNTDRSGNNGEALTVSPLRWRRSRAALEGSWRVAFPPEISTGEAVVAGP